MVLSKSSEISPSRATRSTAVGVIIGAAFGKIVDSLVKDIVMPLVNFLLGGSVDFSNKFLVLSMPAGYNGPMTYADLTKAGANVFAWGNFVTIIINFVLLAFVIFWMVKAIYKARAKSEEVPARPPPRRKTWPCCVKSAIC